MAGPTRILVVEDDPEVRSAIRMVLEAEAYEVAESGDGADALVKLRATPQPSLILLDLMMPGMNGWQFMDEVRVHPDLRRSPSSSCPRTGARTASAPWARRTT